MIPLQRNVLHYRDEDKKDCFSGYIWNKTNIVSVGQHRKDLIRQIHINNNVALVWLIVHLSTEKRAVLLLCLRKTYFQS